MKVFLAIAKADAPITAKDIAAWIDEMCGGEKPVSEKYLETVLRKMREQDEHRRSDRLLETEGGKNPYRYKPGKYTVKTTASAEMLIKFNTTFHKGHFLTREAEEQILKEINVKHGIPIPTLEERLDKAIKGKYLSRDANGILTALERIRAEIDLLQALVDFDADIQGEKRTQPDGQESNLPSQNTFPLHTKKKR